MSLSLKQEFENMLTKESRLAIELSADNAMIFGVDIYLIGGIVRDFIMHNKIKDIDIAVEGDAIEFAEFLSSKVRCRIIQIQENLKTAKIIFPSGVEIDFASTREEIYTGSGILPKAHNFGCNLKNDVKRRDFTINTLAIKLTDNKKYELVDYFGGYQDILNKKIKILHEKSFIDDPSRIIRALKFKERFDFEIDEKTYNLMLQYLKIPDKNMPLERIKSEVKQYFSIDKEDIYERFIESESYKLFCDNPVQVINKSRLNEIKTLNIPEKPDIRFIYFACLVINSDYTSLRFNLTAREIKIINQVREFLFCNTEKQDNLQIYKSYKDADNQAVLIYYLLSGDKNVIKFLSELKNTEILTTGKDLIELGFKPSKSFSDIFDLILKEKLDGKLKTKEEETEFIKNNIKKESE